MKQTIECDYGQFYVFDAVTGPDDPKRGFLADRGSLSRGSGVGTEFAVVYTASQYGPVEVSVESLSEPPALELGSAEACVEVSMILPSGKIIVASWDDSGPRFLTSVPQGSVRVRVLGFGLDDAANDEERRESFLIQVWAAPPTEPVVHRQWATFLELAKGAPEALV